MMIQMNFRYDINGLRAYAVAFVVLFHFGVFGLTGGFIGVDIFFVISGFLMTKIIMDALKKNNFSILQFYTNRAIRIIPALAILCIFLLIVGWFELIPTDYKALSKHVIASLFFVSNMVYWRESGYFDPDSHEKILLHTWSLSVEWQFYLILPIYLIIAYKVLKNKTIYSLIFLFFISLIFASILSAYRPSTSFYLLPTRAWEMVIGGFLYFIPKPNINKFSRTILEILGFILIVFSLYFFTPKTPWPSLYTLAPTIGTLLILYVQNQNSILTNNKVLQFLGSSSYSIYLWHWPIVFWLFYKDQQNNIYFIVTGVVLSIVLGYLSAKYIEKGLGNKIKNKSTIKINIIISFFCISIVILASFIFMTQGAKIKQRLAANTPQALVVEKYIKEHETFNEDFFRKCDVHYNYFIGNGFKIDSSCITPSKPNSKSIFLWGDSHSWTLSLGIRSKYPDYNFFQVGSSACKPSLIESKLRGEYKVACDLANELALSNIKKLKPTTVVMAQQNEHNKTDWISIINELKSAGVKNIVIVGAVPQWKPSLPKIMIKDKHFNNPSFFINDDGLDMQVINDDKIAEKIVKNLKNKQVSYISIINKMCIMKHDKYFCQTRIDKNELTYVDYGHLTRKASIYVVKNFIDLPL